MNTSSPPFDDWIAGQLLGVSVEDMAKVSVPANLRLAQLLKESRDGVISPKEGADDLLALFYGIKQGILDIAWEEGVKQGRLHGKFVIADNNFVDSVMREAESITAAGSW